MKSSIMLHFNRVYTVKQHAAAFHPGLHCSLSLKQASVTEIHHSTYDPLKCTMGCPILIVSICLGKSIRIQRVNQCFPGMQPFSIANAHTDHSYCSPCGWKIPAVKKGSRMYTIILLQYNQYIGTILHP